MIGHFMISDLIGTSVAFLLFALFIFIPGYVAGWFANIFAFRRRTLLARFAMSVPLSIGLFPILTYLLWHWSPVATWMMYGGCLISFVALMLHEREMWLSRPPVTKKVGIILAIIAGWILLGMLCLVDLQLGDRIYSPTVAHDYMLRTAVTAAITRTGIPAANPYFFPGRPFVLRYHYFWMMPCSLVEQLGGSLVSPRQALIGATLWCGIGLMALVPLYLRFFQPKGAFHIERRTLIGIALLSVTGLDIVPVTLFEWVTGRIVPSIEWWNSPVAAWITSVLWVPHHVASLIACLTGFLVIWQGRRARYNRVCAGVVAGLMFASAVGLSVYVTFVFAVFLAIWLGIAMAKKYESDVVVICISGVVALAAAGVFLFELHQGKTGQTSEAGFPVQFTIRPFTFAEALVETFWPQWPWLKPAVDLLLLRMNYLLELGLFFTIGMLQWKRMRSSKVFFNQKELCGFTMVVTAILICTFLRSTVIIYNDLSWRGFLLAQFILLIWGAELWDEGVLQLPGLAQGGSAKATSSKNQRFLIAALLTLGVAGSLYEVCMVRFYPVISDGSTRVKNEWLSPDRNLGKRAYALREIYETLRDKLPDHAIVQHNLNVVPGDLFYGLYADRQAAAETSQCGVVFGGDPALCHGIKSRIDSFFEGSETMGADAVDAACKDLSIDVLIVKDTDKVWGDRESWVWKKQPVLANNYARAFLCGADVKHDTSR
jgi:hypothetical protein